MFYFSCILKSLLLKEPSVVKMATDKLNIDSPVQYTYTHNPKHQAAILCKYIFIMKHWRLDGQLSESVISGLDLNPLQIVNM